MKLLMLSVLLGLLAPAILAIAPQKAVIVTYPDQTPESVMDQAKGAIREAGGTITHEYNLIKGFAAKASEKTLQTVSTLNAEYNPWIEEDSIVSIDGDVIENGHLN